MLATDDRGADDLSAAVLDHDHAILNRAEDVAAGSAGLPKSLTEDQGAG